MTQPLFLGIDGGGSNLRIAIVDRELAPLSSLTEAAANPSIIGHEAARAHIRRSVRQCLRLASLQPGDISAVAIGIAGASNAHSRRWLVQTMKPVLPRAWLVPSSDLEIALVGALAERHGILLLAGTGSAVFGIAPGGDQLQIGGWGYLLGDQGSGYWIGSQVLRQIIADYDSGDRLSSPFDRACLTELGLDEPRELIAWLYGSQELPAARLASLAPFVLRLAAKGDGEARNILQSAAIQLARQAELLRRRLDYDDAPIAFAGGLLDNANFLSEHLANRLQLRERPIAKYAPVIGAALLAKLEWSKAKTS